MAARLKVMGRSPRTIEWYAQKTRSYLDASDATRLSELTTFELKRFLGGLRDRGLAPNTIHGFFETLKALASWAQREHYPVDADLLRLRAPTRTSNSEGPDCAPEFINVARRQPICANAWGDSW